MHPIRITDKQPIGTIEQLETKMRPPINAFREALKATASGTATVLLSTVTSCAFAIVIETGAHRLQYKLFPHWYDGKVKYAMGLPHLQYQKLESEMDTNLRNTVNEPAKEKQKDPITVEAISFQQNEASSMWKDEVQLADDKSQSKFQSYQEQIEEKAQMSAERVSKILLTTAMTG